MSAKCYICGRGPSTGNNVSHSNRRTRRWWHINLQPVRILEDGKKKKVRVCTKCIRSGKVKRAA